MRTSLYAGLLVLAASAGALNAEPFDKADCKTLGAEHAGLIAAGLKADMEKGADWGKANLGEDRLKLIARLIEVEESLAFRCRSLAIPIKRREVLPTIDAAAGEELDTPAPAQDKLNKAPAKKKPATAAVSPEGSPPVTTGSTEAPKPAVVRLKTKKAAAKPKPAETAKPEPPGLFDIN